MRVSREGADGASPQTGEKTAIPEPGAESRRVFPALRGLKETRAFLPRNLGGTTESVCLRPMIWTGVFLF